MLTNDQKTILNILQAHNGTHTFVCDEMYTRTVPAMKIVGLVVGGGHFIQSGSVRETLGITAKGIAALAGAEERLNS